MKNRTIIPKFTHQWSAIGKSLFLLGVVLITSTVVAQNDVKLGKTSNKMGGPHSLEILCELIGAEVRLDDILRLSNWNQESGVTMYGLADAAHHLGLNAVRMKLSMKELVRLNQPVIAFVDNNHFLVVEKAIDDQLRLINPGEGIFLISQTNFAKTWSGSVLLVSKKETVGGSQPNIQFEELVYDFGNARQQEIVVHEFKFKNAGDATLVISKVKPSCAYRATLLSASDVPPGGEGVIKAEFPTKLWRWERTVNIQVHSNDPLRPISILTLQGTVAGRLSVSPNYVYLGDISGQETIKKTIEIFDPGHGKLRIKKVTSTSRHIVTEILRQKKNKLSSKVSVTIKPGLPFGKIEERVIITTNDKQTPQVEVLVKGTVHGEISLFPKSLFFGFVERGKTTRREITVTKTGKNNLEILKIESTSDLIVTELATIEEGAKYRVQATCNTTNTDLGTLKESIKIFTNNSQQPLIEVPLYAIIR